MKKFLNTKENKKALIAAGLLLTVAGAQPVYAAWSGWTSANLTANTISTTSIRQTKGASTSTFAIGSRNQTMWSNPQGRANNATSATSWITLTNGQTSTGTISTITGRVYTLQLRGAANQLGTDSLDARLNVDH